MQRLKGVTELKEAKVNTEDFQPLLLALADD